MNTQQLSDNIVKAKAVINFRRGDLHNYYDSLTHERRVYQHQLNKCAYEENQVEEARK